VSHKDPEVRRAYQAAYRAAHAEHLRTLKAAYAAAHRAEIHVYNVAYRAAHLAEALARDAAYHGAHREENRTRCATYRAAHLAEERTRAAAYRAAHPEVASAHTRRHRAAKRNAPVNDFTAAQWREMQEHFEHRCAYCGRQVKGHLTRDHLTPLSKGGSHTLANIVPACRSCNSKKHAGPVLKPVQPLLL